MLQDEDIDDETQLISEWLKYIGMVGYMDFEKYIKLPSKLINNIVALKVAESLKQNILTLQETKDKEERKKLNSNILELQAFFK